jgi:hypothetical protein
MGQGHPDPFQMVGLQTALQSRVYLGTQPHLEHVKIKVRKQQDRTNDTQHYKKDTGKKNPGSKAQAGKFRQIHRLSQAGPLAAGIWFELNMDRMKNRRGSSAK